MEAKPKHLNQTYAAQFKDTSIADAYHHRPPYPQETIQKLLELVVDQPCTILDAGCGTGDLARWLVTSEGIERIDAVDFSQAMQAKGKALPGGNHPHLNWIYGRIEEVDLHPPYALITAGESLHWMEWQVILPRFRRMLTPHGYLAIAGRETEHTPWNDILYEIITRYSTNKDFQPYDLIEELEKRQLFEKQGVFSTRPVPFTQSVDDYIESFHSRNGLSRERMGTDAARAFDEELRSALANCQNDGLITLSVSGQITWGLPAEHI